LEPERSEETPEASLDPLAYLKKKLTPIPFGEVPIKPPQNAPDAKHFLTFEKWNEYVEGRTGTEIIHAVRERDPALRAEVRICIERFAADIAVKLSKADHEVRAAMADYIGWVFFEPSLRTQLTAISESV
jgi:hypothetical protein